ncbi:YokU family protein [Bacillus testis]|uniref:YokU family protein n=1 Tax=Bacillus testis TaxID=1622072 RepID=UPI00067F25CC|nr:YokU family protein [Bacillus testis]
MWCEETPVTETEDTVYWELPDGSRAIEIKEVPSRHCPSCSCTYQDHETIKGIENHLFIINTSILANTLSYKELMEQPKLLKKNYFDFT